MRKKETKPKGQNKAYIQNSTCRPLLNIIIHNRKILQYFDFH